MPIVDEKGKLFGIVNILDLAILCFFVVLVLSLFLYSKYPLQIKEHRDVMFQMVFIGIDDQIAQQVFVPGKPLIATYAKEDRAVVTSVEKVVLYYYDINLLYNITRYIVTINGSLEVDAEGDFLFNGNDVAPGNYHEVQIGTSYLIGHIWRVDYEHSIQTIEIVIQLTDPFVNSTTPEDIIFNAFGNRIGKVITVNHEHDEFWNMTLSIQADVYDGAFFVSEMPIQTFYLFYFVVDNIGYKGRIIGVTP